MQLLGIVKQTRTTGQTDAGFSVLRGAPPGQMAERDWAPVRPIDPALQARPHVILHVLKFLGPGLGFSGVECGVNLEPFPKICAQRERYQIGANRLIRKIPVVSRILQCSNAVNGNETFPKNCNGRGRMRFKETVGGSTSC